MVSCLWASPRGARPPALHPKNPGGCRIRTLHRVCPVCVWPAQLLSAGTRGRKVSFQMPADGTTGLGLAACAARMRLRLRHCRMEKERIKNRWQGLGREALWWQQAGQGMVQALSLLSTQGHPVLLPDHPPHGHSILPWAATHLRSYRKGYSERREGAGRSCR